MWEAWTLSKQLGKTPAEVYFIKDELAAWCFNRAVVMFGMSVEHDVEESTENAKTTSEAKRKAKRTLDKWLREPDDDAAPRFRDPAVR